MELERFEGRHYHEGVIRLDSCCSALMCAIELREADAVWLPDYMCDVVGDACCRAGAAVRTYRVGEDLLPEYGFAVGEGEFLLLADYFGQLSAADVARASGASGGRLLVDETQGFFRPPWPGADTLYTCRKFFGVPDGGYLAARDGARLGRELPRAESHGHMAHLLGRLERPAGEFLQASRENNERLAGGMPAAMSVIAEILLNAVDYGAVRCKREENFALLHERLGETNLLEVRLTPGPFAYPLLVEDAGDVRARLAERGVYVPTLWPNVLEERPRGSVAWRYARNVLPLPVDQRYGAEEMERIVEVLAECLN